MKHELITTDRELEELCRALAGAERIAFDTEFVSEDTYRPQLCLVQVAAAGRLAVIDPLKVQNLQPFWAVLAEGGHETIVHAGRQEIEFSLAAIGRLPNRLFDVQIAAGMVGLEYPASYGSLVSKLLGLTPQKGETRTDWRRRPLSERQIEYALADVDHLGEMRDKLGQRLARLKRTAWFESEMADWLTSVQEAQNRERWRKVAGSSGLPPRGLALVREIWTWRESEASRRNCPVKRVLRDDLIVELARRRSTDPKQIRAIRGMERGDLARSIPELSAAIDRALKISDADCPRVVRTDNNSQLNLLGQFLSSALGSICRAAEVAPSIVGTASDVRELVAFTLAGKRGEPPLLAHGWRADVVGQVFEDLLEGKLSIRIRDPKSDQPLEFERAEVE
ncbi:MAG TPA: ribonuclease D [Pirellulales bacterium]|nr:ribonuclease D [Pirellulales bacterium]